MDSCREYRAGPHHQATNIDTNPSHGTSRVAEASAMTASHGNFPVAASPLSITASVPSHTAFLGDVFGSQGKGGTSLWWEVCFFCVPGSVNYWFIIYILGDGHSTSNDGNPNNGYLNPYWKVDEFIPTIGKQWEFRSQHNIVFAKLRRSCSLMFVCVPVRFCLEFLWLLLGRIM